MDFGKFTNIFSIFTSLFINIPLEETLDIFTNTLFENIEIVQGISKRPI